MTATEDRLRDALAERAGTVREDTLRPLAVPARRRRRWPRLAAPLAAATAVVLAVGAEIVVGQLTGAPTAAKPVKAGPAIHLGGSLQSMALDAANQTLYAVTYHGVPRDRYTVAGPGTLAMVSTAACNATGTSGCAHVSSVPTGGKGASGLAVDDRTHTVYVLNAASRTLAVIDANTCNAASTGGCRPTLVSLAEIPAFIAVNPRTGTIYVTGARARGTSVTQIAVINGTRCNATDTSGCGTPPEIVDFSRAAQHISGIAAEPATNTLYVLGPAGLAVIDARACTGTDTSGCTDVLATAKDGSYGVGLAVDYANGTLYLPSFADDAVLAFNLRACSAVDTAGCARPRLIRGGPQPSRIAVDPGTGTGYVLGDSNTVTMIDTARCNAAGAAACPGFPVAFPVPTGPQQIAVAPAVHTVYVGNSRSVSLVSTATCNVARTSGCPAQSPHGTPPITAFTCSSSQSRYESGEPAGLLTKTFARVATGSAGGLAWSVWARKGIPYPYGVEQGGLVLNGRWYALCDGELSAGPNGFFALVDAGTRGVVYGFVQHPTKVTVRVGISGPRWTPASARFPGVTVFVLRLPRSACAYHGLAVNAWQGSVWGGYSNAAYGKICAANLPVPITVGQGGWGGRPRQHW